MELLSPNAGKEKYLLENNTGIIHYLKNENKCCKILEVGVRNACLTQTYHEAEEIALIRFGKPAIPCKYCCKE